ncbi:MAG: 30S ribosomal protein S19 [Candidatus Magasanikbacteria bacterium RIFCSPHIGHO2_01_FULL_41_23]|uniref:Small ribosomal subunit protein uS19 n=1 Tax=Candidatus Magasanikbacteria bacterium RIFCSPLOWO2_01_FULL_40_15 TaxID=1798686 RepID=A0A1F6N2R8_9BACT|nr:MAG: 30S ribosomal protein S19 [Candidatus Magasanikbacteria bacterium RIFCSPHIGHO2_01_FULL_41_23]OGH66816.1 MAG: 30S ribosomal protein S19 [Candidatus Magasanikbacteria bacterium RIFCSPHIGHO2_02_FULL_41_35]OGH76664.1 MAG: 30S ribosomal protein S19 [Candidatus Magasanikbacteria bacterium RIFCSPHIGHO2_12_FULL_41_16]OGH78000.1 MAG: 30S ribosomal protein S19 [Candidatus Magasanikbacteria bacterium RIFCSPLOWO2_01_FULL_40_15]
MSRSLKKGPFTDVKLMAKVTRAKEKNDRKAIKTWARASTITPEMVGMSFEVHNGKNFLKVFVEENMVGHKLGEFSPTRKFIAHGGKMAKEQSKTAAGASSTASTSSASTPARGAAAPAKKK